jgi:multidrug efflux pump subunit AcrA (membrane-fusion protein)
MNMIHDRLYRWFTSAALAASLSAAATGCTDNSGAHENAVPPPQRAEVSEGGATITFPPGSVGLSQITGRVVKKGRATISAIAPARVVASILPATTGGDRIILFESADATSLWSSYRQARSNVNLTAASLTRIKEMFENQGATVKDLNQAEVDAANARAAMAESDGKLRALGYNPAELERTTPNTIWLIADVQENQLDEVQKGEDVDVVFSSFPDKKFNGKAEAVGDVIDPVTRTLKVRVTMPNPRGKLLPGMFARVDFGDPMEGALVLPLSAIVTVDGKDYAFVESAPGVFVRRPVTLAHSGATETVVLSGIDDGDKVVMAGAMLLKGLSFGF